MMREFFIITCYFNSLMYYESVYIYFYVSLLVSCFLDIFFICKLFGFVFGDEHVVGCRRDS